MNMRSELNYQKQLKNAKRGGHKASFIKDLNKHKIQKLQRLIKELEIEQQEHLNFWKQNAALYDQGYATALDHIQHKLLAILQLK